MSTLQLDAINLDPELQPRAKIDVVMLENYVQLLVDGTKFPPITVFRTDDYLLLSDGFHRWHAHKVLGFDTIEAEVLDGTRRDALLYSLSANAKHGLPRNQLDYTRAYEIAQRNELVDPLDEDAVAKLLGCSVNWAEKLARPLKNKLRAARDAAILAGKDEGKSNREIARENGIDRRAVDRFVGGSNPPQGENDPPQTGPVLLPDPPAWRQQLEELSSGPARNWSSALRALRLINEQISVDYLFADRYAGFDHVVGPELEKAFLWISDLRERFDSERNNRRRA